MSVTENRTTKAAAVTSRVRGLPTRTFGPASEEPYRRRTSDRIRVATAAVVMAVLVANYDTPSGANQSLFAFFNGLPDDLQPLFETLYWVGTLWAVLIVAAAALIARRWRLARDLAIAGVLAGILTRVVGQFVDGDSVSKVFDATIRLNTTPSFPLVRLSVVTAVVCAASPYVTLPTRRYGRLLLVALAISAMYLGIGYPSDVLGGLILGWGTAALVHLAFGSPGGRPTTPQVLAALDALGVAATDLKLDPDQPIGATRFLGHDDEGPISVRVLGRDEADSQLLSKVWRFVAYKDSGPHLYLAREQEIEHQAYVALLAERAGVRVPEVLVAGTAGPGAALIVARMEVGRPLAELDPDDVDDARLDALWRQVQRLQAARIAHGDLNTRNFIVADGGAEPVLIGFVHATTGADPRARAADVANLLASTAVLVGDERAVAAMTRVMGTGALTDVVPVLQRPALVHGTQTLLGKHRDAGHRIDALRAHAAEQAGIDVPELVELHRVSPTNLMMAIGTLIAAAVLLGQVGSPQEIWDTMKNAQWGLVVLALVLSLATNVPYAIALMGCVPIRLPLWLTTETQLAMSFGNLAIPAIGGIAIQIRFLQKRGLDLASAVAAGGLLSTVAGVTIQIALFGVALLLAPDAVDIGPVDVDSAVRLVLLGVVVVLIASAVIWGIPKLRAAVVPPVKSAAGTVWEALRSPRRVLQLVVGNAGVSLMYGFALLACIEAYGGSVNYWSLLAANIGVSTIASLVPVPGGNTAVATIGMSGALVALGVSDAVAVSAILTQQIVVSYVPAVPGWWASNDLLKRGEI